MRTARAAPLCLSGRGTHVLLQLHQRLLQSHPAAFRPGVSLTHLLRTGDANRPTVRHPLNRPRKRGNFTCSPFPGATKNSTSMQRGPDCLSGSNATQNEPASTRSPIQGSDKPACAAIIFNHNGARPRAAWLLSPLGRKLLRPLGRKLNSVQFGTCSFLVWPQAMRLHMGTFPNARLPQDRCYVLL